METINSRIAQIIDTQCRGNKSAFAREVGLTPAYAAQLYSSQREPSDRTISDICRIFGVNPVWLKTGIGEPFAPQSRESRITDILSKAIDGASTSRDRLIRALARLPDDAFPLIEQYILEAAENIQAEKKE
ncbi:MAG TPA: hypothetical protein DDY87_03555 [Clostridiales bacterium]|nr:hypothetical protein [Clostridiales bacterium]